MALPTYEDHFVEVGGKSVHYWVEGQGPAVILVHGLASSAEFWRYNVGPLAQRHRVHALDLLGFGMSDKDIGEFSLPYAASVMAEFMDALGIERATLVGNSMGGIICAQVAVQFPSRLDKLILVDSAGFGRELGPFLRLWCVPLVGSLVFSFYQRTFPLLKRWVFYDSSSIDEVWLAGAGAMLRTPGVKESSLEIARVGVDLRGQRQDQFGDLHRQLAHVTAPTLIIWGSQDPVVPMSHAYRAHQLIPNSQVRIMERCGHTPQVERPRGFNRLVLDFLAASHGPAPTT